MDKILVTAGKIKDGKIIYGDYKNTGKSGVIRKILEEKGYEIVDLKMNKEEI